MTRKDAQRRAAIIVTLADLSKGGWSTGSTAYRELETELRDIERRAHIIANARSRSRVSG